MVERYGAVAMTETGPLTGNGSGDAATSPSKRRDSVMVVDPLTESGWLDYGPQAKLETVAQADNCRVSR